MNQNVNHDPTEIPSFKSHDEARDWFKGQYGNDFLLRSTDVDNGRKVMYYHLVKNPDMYQSYMESFAATDAAQHEITNMGVFKSYSTITIDEDGQVKFIDQK